VHATTRLEHPRDNNLEFIPFLLSCEAGLLVEAAGLVEVGESSEPVKPDETVGVGI